MQFIDEFEEDSFWEKLGSNLAKRDLISEIGFQQFENMEPFDRFQELHFLNLTVNYMIPGQGLRPFSALFFKGTNIQKLFYRTSAWI